jgi:hypothetical protein
VFDTLERARAELGGGDVVVYRVSQTSLEQVFLDLVQHHEAASRQGEHTDEARGSAPYWSVPTEGFTARAILFNLVLGCVVSWTLWGLLLSLYLTAAVMLILPPCGNALAGWTLSTMRAFARVELAMATAYGSADRYASHAAPALDAVLARERRGWTKHARTLFYDAKVQRSVVYLLLVRFGLSLLVVCASAALLMVGIGTVVLFPATCVIQRRLAVWQRQLAMKYLVETGETQEGPRTPLSDTP